MKQEKTAQPLLADAFKALGFDPTPLGTENDGKQAKPKKRSKTKGEQAQEGLTPKASGDPSPYAHWGSVPPSRVSSPVPTSDAGLFTPSSVSSLEPTADAGDYTASVFLPKYTRMYKSPMYLCSRLRILLMMCVLCATHSDAQARGVLRATESLPTQMYPRSNLRRAPPRPPLAKGARSWHFSGRLHLVGVPDARGVSILAQHTRVPS